ncbi:hypothetical protein Y1Q_0009882 [Alligator mississippiensis]|uniref:Uncharacterized protein n=1 Tax=Alligator mississippiensis TaxID=8496 RepID=A0A151MWZ7_ALLMI|nr:hypothetical protein Y1Q_0009882 [Alligator mississippiensis]
MERYFYPIGSRPEKKDLIFTTANPGTMKLDFHRQQIRISTQPSVHDHEANKWTNLEGAGGGPLEAVGVHGSVRIHACMLDAVWTNFDFSD